jgi:hypothetical protein
MHPIDSSAHPLETPSIANLLQSPELLGNRTSTIHTIAFVDAHVADATTLMANIHADMTVLLDPNRDGVEQITASLSHYQNLTGIEIVSHGSAAQVQLGKNSLDTNSLSQYTNELQQWHTALAPGADILFYGCNVAADTTGTSFINTLSNLTGADIAASTNLTGNAAKGGDWTLEYSTGRIETPSPFTDSFTSNYQGLLTSVFTTQTPDNPNQSDGAGSAGDYELGLEFVSAKAGQIDAIRYYKAPSETGSHTGRIWSSTGTLLGSVAFTNETASGWQQQSLTTPISIAANTTYAVSVNANSYFAVSGNAISPAVVNGELSTVANGSGFNPTPGLFPSFSNNSNYFRDVVFTPSAPPPTNQPGTISVTGTPTQNQVLTATVADADGLTGVTINYKWQQSADNGTTWTDITGATSQTFTLGQAQVNNRVRGTANYTDVLGTTENLFGTPTAAVVNVNDVGTISLNGIQSVGSILTANVADADGLTGVSVNYQWQQSNDNGTTWTNITGATSKTLTLAQAQANNRVRANAIYTDTLGAAENVFSAATSQIASSLLLESVFTTQTPDNPNQSDGVGSAGDYELGLEFVSAKAGQINAVRYYKAPSETGIHTGRIWSSTGTLLASVAFANETASGWQQQSLMTPISIAANTTYAVSVNANSYFAVSGNAISPAIVNGDLSTVANGSGFNGTPGLFPSFSNNSNYFRDIVFSPNSTSPTNQPGTISVTGTPTQNQILTANVADADGLTGVNINYKWQQSTNNGTTWTDITGATSQTFTLGQAQVNNRVRATATYSDALGNNENLLGTATAAVVNVNDLGSIAVAGSVAQNQILTATVADIDGLTGVTINYKWQQSANNGATWTDIVGATSQSLTLGQAQVNSRVRANATYTDALGGAENVLSAATVPVIGNKAGIVTVSGTVRQNQILTANVTDGDGLTASTIKYKWQQSGDNGTTWTDIAGATNKTITLTQAQVTKKVRATATYTDALGVAENPLSAASVAVVNVNDVGKVILKGSAAIGGTLTETILDSDGLGSNTQYVWQQSTNNGLTWSNIAGATTKSFALTNTQLGKQVRLRTSYIDALGSSENIFSAGTNITAQNAIVLENQKLGTTDWQIPDPILATNNEIAGYGDATSINKGQALNLKVSLAQAGQYAIDVYRLGYYNGDGGRLVAGATGLNGVTQAAPTIDPTTRLVECKWNTSYTLQTGADWTSGMYLAKLTDSRTGKQSEIEFVVRDDGRPAELGFQEASNTAEAYNNYGGYSAYAFNSLNNQAAYKVSFDRPLSTSVNSILGWEYQAARWMESQGYDISYYSNIDVQTNPLELYSQNAFLSVGHDEYWSMEMRNNVEQARDNGTNLGFFSANSAYWRVRFEPSSTGTANRVMATYKGNWNLDPIAQADNSLATNTFRSPQVNRPENALIGVMYTGSTNNITTGYDFVVSNAADPYYAGTGLQNGDKIPGLVGYEFDAVVNNGLTPAGLVVLSQSPVIPDGGVAPGLPAGTNTNVSNSVRYTAASGAKVFATGSIQWVWGLSSDLAPNPRVSPVAQKIASNILADFGAQARTPQILTTAPVTTTATIAATPVAPAPSAASVAAPVATTAAVVAAQQTANDLAIKKATRNFVPEEG